MTLKAILPHTRIRLCRGSSLVELLVSLSLLGMVTTLTALSLKRVVSATSRLSSYTDATRSLIDALVLINSALDAAESSRLPGRLRVHRNGQITFPDNSIHAISKLRGTSQPRTDSDALSVIDSAVEHAGAISSITWSPYGIELTYCVPTNVVGALSSYRSAIVRSVQGAQQFRIHTQKRTSLHGTPCLSLVGNFHKSLFLHAQPALSSFQRITPVRREFTLYIDRSSHLRLVSHLGGQILENQPIVPHLKRLTITRGESMYPMTVNVEIEARATKPFRWSRIIALPEGEDLRELFS